MEDRLGRKWKKDVWGQANETAVKNKTYCKKASVERQLNKCLKLGKKMCKLCCGKGLSYYNRNRVIRYYFLLGKITWEVKVVRSNRDCASSSVVYSCLLSLQALILLYMLYIFHFFSFITSMISLPCILISICLPLQQDIKWILYTELFPYSSHFCSVFTV